MAGADKQILGPNSSVSVNGTDISQYCTSVTAEDTAEDVDVTGFKATYRIHEKGLRDSTITTTIIQGTATDNLISPIYYNDTAGTVKVTPDTNGTVVYTQISKPFGWSPIGGGGPGDLNTVDVTWMNNGTAGLTRGTA